MKLKENSFSANFYKWVYETKQLPKNLCPYFWKLLLGWVIWIIFGIPIAALLVPMLVISLFDKEIKGDLNGNKYGFAVAGAIIYFLIFCVASVVIFLLTLFSVIQFVEDEGFYDLQMIGGMITFVLIIFGIIAGILYLHNNKNRPDKNIDKSPNIVKEFIKAKYNRYCPKIDWE